MIFISIVGDRVRLVDENSNILAYIEVQNDNLLAEKIRENNTKLKELKNKNDTLETANSELIEALEYAMNVYDYEDLKKTLEKAKGLSI